jgi:hypothetical protein
MLPMSLLEPEQLRIVLMDTKNYVQKIHLVYSGSLNSAVVRISKIFREPIRTNIFGWPYPQSRIITLTIGINGNQSNNSHKFPGDFRQGIKLSAVSDNSLFGRIVYHITPSYCRQCAMVAASVSAADIAVSCTVIV